MCHSDTLSRTMFPAFKTVLVPDYTVPPVPPPPPAPIVILEERRTARRKRLSISHRRSSGRLTDVPGNPPAGGPPGLPFSGTQGSRGTQFGESQSLPASAASQVQANPRVEAVPSTATTHLHSSVPSNYWENSMIMGEGDMSEDEEHDPIYVSSGVSESPIQIPRREVYGATPSPLPKRRKLNGRSERILRFSDMSPMYMPARAGRAFVVEETPPRPMRRFRFVSPKFKFKK